MKTLCIILTALIGCACAALAQTPCDELSRYPLRFAILGDRTGDHQAGVYESIVAEVERMRPDFVMTVGDQIEGYISDTAEMRSQWDEYFDIVKVFSMPVYFTPGNHDITSDAMEPTYRGRIGEPYRSFDHRGVHIVILDNSRTENTIEIPIAQLDWLKADLEKNQNACYTLVFFHKPFWYRTLGGGKPDALHEIFKANGVDAVFSGHFHQYFSATYDGIMYTCIGSSGGATEESPDGLLYHFGWVTIDSSGIHVVPLRRDAVLPWDVQTLAEARAAALTRSEGISFVQPMALDDGMALSEGTVSVVLRNLLSDVSCTDTLRWEVPKGWSVSPAVQPFTLAGGETQTMEFAVKPAAATYPLPRISTRLPYGQGRSTTVSQDLEVARTIECGRVLAPIVIDGQLSEETWQLPLTALFNNDGSAMTSDSTSFYFAYDDDNLYVAAYCHESVMDDLRATMTQRDDAVYTEDAVGVMFQPQGPTGAIPQFYVNPLGTVCDQLISRGSDGYWSGETVWNGEIETQTTRSGNAWTVEMRIPLAQFAQSGGVGPKQGDRWRVNFRRKQARLNAAVAFQIPWAYQPTYFGELLFQ